MSDAPEFRDSDNGLLFKIAKAAGAEVTQGDSNNNYLRAIARSYGAENLRGESDNQLLRKWLVAI